MLARCDVTTIVSYWRLGLIEPMTLTLVQIEKVRTNQQLQKVFAEESVQEAVMSCGLTKPINRLTKEDKAEILKLLCLRDVFFDAKSAIDQFIEGLDEVNVQAQLKHNTPLKAHTSQTALCSSDNLPLE